MSGWGLVCPLSQATIASNALWLGQSCNASSAAASGHSLTSRGQRRTNSLMTAGRASAFSTSGSNPRRCVSG